MSTQAEEPEQVEQTQKQDEGLVHKLEHKLEDGWHHLEDLTGGRAHIEAAGEDQVSNFEGIEHHEDAEHH